VLSAGRMPMRGDRPAAVATVWHALAGDAGWAGVLAESFLADPRRPVFLVFRPGMELLPLFVEAIALLPVSRRWGVEFSTSLTTLPPRISCPSTGVLEGAAQAQGARRRPNARIVDLCRHLDRARGGSLLHLTRTGERIVIPDAGVPAPSGGRHPSSRPAGITTGPSSHPRTSNRETRPDGAADRDW